MEGTHLIIEFRNCDVYPRGELLKSALVFAAEKARMEVLHSYFYDFTPQGSTAFVALSESHASIHTSPEDDYVAIDVFTCGLGDPYVIMQDLIRLFRPSEFEVKVVSRG